jgi:hypothetical protein
MKKKILNAADMAWAAYKKSKEKVKYHLGGGEYGARQNERVKRYKERGERLNEKWTK